MDDLIYRHAAIDALDEYFGRIGKLKRRGLTKGERAISLDVVGAIRTLPSVEAEPVRLGHWVYGEDDHGIDGYHCNKCGFFVPWDYTHKFISFIEDYHHCPHCGALMDKET